MTSDDQLDNTYRPDTDVDQLRNGGPTRTPGAMTTTGGTAGPASVALAHARHRTPDAEPSAGAEVDKEPPADDDLADPQEAHGGSMAPSLVDDTGHPVAERPSTTAP